MRATSPSVLFVLVVTALACALGIYFYLAQAGDIREEEVTRIALQKDGFNPKEVTVKKGTTVTFASKAGKPFWPASNLHPSHQIYPEFDPKRPLEPDEEWSFTFEKGGDWPFHDHIRSYYTGTIHVIE